MAGNPNDDDQWPWTSVSLALGLTALCILFDVMLIRMGVSPRIAVLLGLAQVVVILVCIKPGKPGSSLRRRLAHAAIAFLQGGGGA